MSELDYYKLKEIAAFKEELVKAGTISQGKVKAFEERIGKNIITSNHKLALFTGLESVYGHQEAISILDSLLSEPGTESILINRSSLSITSTVCGLINYAIRTFRTDNNNDRASSLSDIIYNSLDTVVLDNTSVDNDRRLGELTIIEFINSISAVLNNEEDCGKIFKGEKGKNYETIKYLRDRTFIIQEMGNKRSIVIDLMILVLFYLEKDKVAGIKGFTLRPISLNLDTLDLLLKNLDIIYRVIDKLTRLETLYYFVDGPINYFDLYNGRFTIEGISNVVRTVTDVGNLINTIRAELSSKREIDEEEAICLVSDFYSLVYEGGVNTEVYGGLKEESGGSDLDDYNASKDNVDLLFISQFCYKKKLYL